VPYYLDFKLSADVAIYISDGRKKIRNRIINVEDWVDQVN
jgi:hypothetical protein